MTLTQFSPIMQRAKDELRKEFNDSITLIRLDGDRVSADQNLDLLVATAMKVVTLACAETASHIFTILKVETDKLSKDQI